jgi:hypothetical protein
MNMSKQCRVYWNFHKKCWSVQTKTDKGWRVTSHTPYLSLRNPKFKVYESGRNKVLSERRKNVHAFIYGDYVDDVSSDCMLRGKIKYNPYEHSEFMLEDGDKCNPINSHPEYLSNLGYVLFAVTSRVSDTALVGVPKVLWAN